MLPPVHELQPSQRTLAVIDPSGFEVEPLSTVIEVAVLEEYVGWRSPVPRRGETVTPPAPSE
jgi:hypothetical protein